MANELVRELRKLAELHRSGVLDNGEFAAAKERLLSGPDSAQGEHSHTTSLPPATHADSRRDSAATEESERAFEPPEPTTPYPDAGSSGPGDEPHLTDPPPQPPALPGTLGQGTPDSSERMSQVGLTWLTQLKSAGRNTVLVSAGLVVIVVLIAGVGLVEMMSSGDSTTVGDFDVRLEEGAATCDLIGSAQVCTVGLDFRSMAREPISVSGLEVTLRTNRGVFAPRGGEGIWGDFNPGEWDYGVYQFSIPEHARPERLELSLGSSRGRIAWPEDARLVRRD